VSDTRARTREWLRSFLTLGRDAKKEQMSDEDVRRQEDTVLRALEILDRSTGVLLADEVGMGKTFEAVGIIACVRHQNRRARILVITPGADLNRQWMAAMDRFREHGFYAFREGEYSPVTHLTQLPAAARETHILFAPIDIFINVRAGEEQQFLLNAFFRWRGLWEDTRRAISKAYFGTVREVADVTRMGPYMGVSPYSELYPLLEDAFRRPARRRELTPEEFEGLDDIYNDYGAEGFKNKQRVRRALARARFKLLNGILPNFSMLVVDEAHKLKNPWSVRSQAVANILFGKYRKTVFLTATPFQLGVRELEQVFTTFMYADITNEERRRLQDEVTELFAKIDDYRAAYDELQFAWQFIDAEKVGEFKRWYAASPTLDIEPASKEVAALADVVRRLLKLKRTEVEPRFRRWMIRSVKEEKNTYRKHIPSKLSPEKRSFLPFMLYERLIFEVFRKHHTTYKAAVEINMTSSFEAATTGALLAESAAAADEDIEAYRRLLREVLSPARGGGGNDHPKVERVVRDARDAMLRGEKMLIFCERNETVHAIKRRCDRVWEAHILRLWQKVFPGRGAGEVWHQQRNYQKYFTTTASPYYLTLRENYARAFAGDDAILEAGVASIIELANETLREVRVGGSSVERVNYKIAKRCLEQAALRRASALRPAIFDELPGHAADAARNILEEEFIYAGLDLVADEEEGDAEDLGAGTHPRWQISEHLAEAVLTPRRDGIWHRMRGDLAILPSEDRVRFVEAVRAFLTRKEVEFLPLLFARAAGAGSDHTADAVRTALEEWWAEPDCTWRDRVHDLLGYCAERNESQRDRILESGLRAGVPVRHTLDAEFREDLKEGFNTPFYPMILICNRPMQEGVDLHRECRILVHHDLSWNPAQLEQRVGRLDRIGSKVRRDRETDPGAMLCIHYPLVDRTIDVRQYRTVKEREKWLDFLLGTPPEFSTYSLGGEVIQPLPEELASALTIRLEPTERTAV
jgi:Helicase conserved C-terminal domain/Type III restriction enzyme, res subunit